MLAPVGPTMDTTYALQLRHPDGSWHFETQAEYTSPDDCHEMASRMYGGAFADDEGHRVVRIERTVI